MTAESVIELTFMLQAGGDSSASLQFSSRIPHSSGFPRKFVTTDFSDCQADSSVSLSASLITGSFIKSLIWGPSNIPALSFSMLIRGNFSRKKTNCCLPCSLPSQNYSLLLTWYVRVESVFCSVQRENETERYASQDLNRLMATLVWYNVVRQPGCTRDTENKDT